MGQSTTAGDAIGQFEGPVRSSVRLGSLTRISALSSKRLPEPSMFSTTRVAANGVEYVEVDLNEGIALETQPH